MSWSFAKYKKNQGWIYYSRAAISKGPTTSYLSLLKTMFAAMLEHGEISRAFIKFRIYYIVHYCAMCNKGTY